MGRPDQTGRGVAVASWKFIYIGDRFSVQVNSLTTDFLKIYSSEGYSLKLLLVSVFLGSYVVSESTLTRKNPT